MSFSSFPLLFRRGVAICALCTAAGFTAASDNTPVPFGLLLVPDDGVTTDVTPSVDRQTLLALEASRDRIAELEAGRGPYDPSLGPLLLEAADRAREAGLNDTAQELYAWALHNTRVNNGLGHQDQIPIVEVLLELAREAGDGEAVNDRQGYLYRLAGNGQPPLDADKLTAALRFMAWQQEWLMLADWRVASRDALDLFNDGRELADTVCTDQTLAGDWCGPVTLRVMATLYLIDYRIDPEMDADYVRRLSPYTDWDQNMADERLFDLERSAYSSGVRLLEAALKVAEDVDELRLALADWRWFQGRTRAALDSYRELLTVFPGRFDVAAPLPEQPSITRDPRLAKDSDAVTVTLQVTARGRARDLVFPDAAAQDDGAQRRARRALRSTRFRPRLDASGEPVASELTLSLVAMR